MEKYDISFRRFCLSVLGSIASMAVVIWCIRVVTLYTIGYIDIQRQPFVALLIFALSFVLSVPVGAMGFMICIRKLCPRR